MKLKGQLFVFDSTQCFRGYENIDAPLSRVSITVSTPRGRTGDGQEGDTGFRRQKLRVIRSVNTVNIGYSITGRLLHCLCIKTWVKYILFACMLTLIPACILVNRRYLRGHRQTKTKTIQGWQMHGFSWMFSALRSPSALFICARRISDHILQPGRKTANKQTSPWD